MSTTRQSQRHSRKSTARRAAAAVRAQGVDIITQVRIAAANPLAAALGAAIGGVVPWFARQVAHQELAVQWAAGDAKMVAMDMAIVLGCVAFSVLTVYGFGRAAIRDPRKAAGFCAALEGVMLVAHGQPAQVALAMLVLINAITTGCVIAMAYAATRKRGEADARRQATAARTRDRRREQAAARGAIVPSEPAEPEGAESTTTPAWTAPASERTAAAPRARRTPVVVPAAPRAGSRGRALVVQARPVHVDVSDAEIVRQWS